MAKGKYEYWLTDEGLLLIGGWAKSGLTDEQIAHNMGICRDTLIQWKKKFPDISYSLKVNKEVADIQVENALFKKALGYKVVDIIYERVKNLDTGEYELVPAKKTERDVPPDTTAQIFWLKNRKPDVWSDRKDVLLNGKVNTVAEMTDEELEKKIASIEKELGITNE
nr:MAG TPA: terminase small subunit [Caudoviricetes sp.]